MYTKLLGISRLDSDATDWVYCIYKCTGEKMREQWAMHQLFIHSEKAYDLGDIVQHFQ
jgi:hypothetical protein